MKCFRIRQNWKWKRERVREKDEKILLFFIFFMWLSWYFQVEWGERFMRKECVGTYCDHDKIIRVAWNNLMRILRHSQSVFVFSLIMTKNFESSAAHSSTHIWNSLRLIKFIVNLQEFLIKRLIRILLLCVNREFLSAWKEKKVFWNSLLSWLSGFYFWNIFLRFLSTLWSVLK